MHVAGALALARGRGVDRLDAQLLLARQLARPRSWLIAHDDAELSAVDERSFLQVVERRASGVPLAYLVGEREFHGLRFAVTSSVLVPRPDTEVLVDWALELLAGPEQARVLDLGTGSGAIAVTLAHRRPQARVTATDNDAAALAVARGNAQALGTAVQFELGPWWQAVGTRTFDLVVSNPPYIAADDPHLPALAHEPLQALTPGGDGLDALRQIVAGAPAHLNPGGWLLLEHGHDQGAAVRALLQGAGLVDIRTRRDLANLERCTGGCHAPV
jgi:release factor glutamine methyltransferase